MIVEIFLWGRWFGGQMKYWAEFALAFFVLAAFGHVPAVAGVPGFAQVGRGSTDIADRCLGREGQAPEQRVIDCTTAAHAMVWQGYSWPRFGRAIAYGELGKLDLAIADLEQAATLGGRHDPNRPAIYGDLCFFRALAGGPFDQALADCNRSLEMRPGDSEALDSRAFVEFKMKNYAAVVTDESAALSGDEKRASAFYLRGIARLNTGDVTNGNADIAQAETINPKIAKQYASYGVRP
jgi:tetratricopeptide (TPR) repeat protein